MWSLPQCVLHSHSFNDFTNFGILLLRLWHYPVELRELDYSSCSSHHYHVNSTHPRLSHWSLFTPIHSVCDLNHSSQERRTVGKWTWVKDCMWTQHNISVVLVSYIVMHGTLLQCLPPLMSYGWPCCTKILKTPGKYLLQYQVAQWNVIYIDMLASTDSQSGDFFFFALFLQHGQSQSNESAQLALKLELFRVLFEIHTSCTLCMFHCNASNSLMNIRMYLICLMVLVKSASYMYAL